MFCKLFVVLVSVLVFACIRKAPFESFACFLVGVSCPKSNISGFVDSNFQNVRAAFEKQFLNGQEVGAQLVAFIDGKLVVDLVGGYAVRDQRLMKHDDLSVIFSSTKVFESLVFAMLIDRQLVDPDAPIAQYWPEFAQNGKEHISVQMMLQHSSGLSALNETLALSKLATLGTVEFDDFLAQQVPTHPTGKNDALITEYHSMTRCLYTDALLRRVDPKKRGMKQFIQEEIVDKMKSPFSDQDVELFVGLPSHLQKRVVQHYGTPLLATLFQIVPQLFSPIDLSSLYESYYTTLFPFERQVIRQILFEPNGILSKSLAISENGQTFRGAADAANSPLFRSLSLASGSGVSNARSIGVIMNELAKNEGLLLASNTLNDLTSNCDEYFDEGLKLRVNYTINGWGNGRLPTILDGWIGWMGAGGSVTQFNVKHKIAFSYVPNALMARMFKPRGALLLKELEMAHTKQYHGSTTQKIV